MNIKKKQPTILIIFGATGDLVSKKILPSIFHLYNGKLLPEKFEFVGLARRDLSNDNFRALVNETLKKHLKKTEKIDTKFLGLLEYKKGDFSDKKSYSDLAIELKRIDEKWGVCSNKLFYLAVPPSLYRPIFINLAESGLTIPCGGEEGWTRVIVEKPFGKDLKTAENLDKLLATLFQEEQIYRIDHYLAKEMLQNILTFRFANSLFEEVWNKDFVERIDVRVWEKIGVEDRGAFYDGVGALRDVGQNHLMQMLALVTMDNPGSMNSRAIRRKREEILNFLPELSFKFIKKNSVRGQYVGYKKIKGVTPKSETETYFKIAFSLKGKKWDGVPVTLESGKRMGEARKDITITFKHPSPCLCPPALGFHYENKIYFTLEPEESIKIKFWSKKPGLLVSEEERQFNFLYRENGEKKQYVEEYEKLLLDCISGDQTLFVSSDEIKAMWKFIDPIIKVWEMDKVSPEYYRPDTSKISELYKNLGDDKEISTVKKEAAMIGLGKMGFNLALRLSDKGWKIKAFDIVKEKRKEAAEAGFNVFEKLPDLIKSLKKPRIIWLMVPSISIRNKEKAPIEIIIKELSRLLEKGDLIIDGGNSFYLDTVRRGKILKKKNIRFIDAGVSGGPAGARNGASLMVGGEEKDVKRFEQIFLDIAKVGGYGYMGKTGAGHFVKMVHNGIEYGMMQAFAEGFSILKKSNYGMNLMKIAGVYDNGSVVESRLSGWLIDAFAKFGNDLNSVSGKAKATGEGEWTSKTAEKLGVKDPIIKASVEYRKKTEKNPDFSGKIIQALRSQFGGHQP